MWGYLRWDKQLYIHPSRRRRSLLREITLVVYTYYLLVVSVATSSSMIAATYCSYIYKTIAVGVDEWNQLINDLSYQVPGIKYCGIH